MYKGKKILAVIQARAGSKGIPGKNIKVLYGKPLIAWSIIEAKKSKYIDKLIVSTDGEEIAEISRKYGAEVPFKRPAEFSTDTATDIQVMTHALDFFDAKGEKFDYIMMIQPTSPLREVKDIDTSIEMLISHPTAKSIIGIALAEACHPEFTFTMDKSGIIKPYLKKFEEEGKENIVMKRRQELDAVYFHEGDIFISDVKTFREKKSFFTKDSMGYVVERYKQFEIDEPMDFAVIESLMKFRENGGFKK